MSRAGLWTIGRQARAFSVLDSGSQTRNEISWHGLDFSHPIVVTFDKVRLISYQANIV